MKKNFLLLLLLTLLPFAGWADNYNRVAMSPTSSSKAFTGADQALPTLALTYRSSGSTQTLPTSTYTVTWKYNGSEVTVANHAGTYTATIAPTSSSDHFYSDNGYTTFSGTYTFTVTKINNTVSAPSFAAGDSWEYGQTPHIPSSSALGGATVTYEYRKGTSGSWSSWPISTTAAPGTDYQIRAHVASTVDYNETNSDASSFTITKAKVYIEPNVETAEWRNPWTGKEMSTITPTVTGAADWSVAQNYLQWSQVQPVGDAENGYDYTLESNGTTNDYYEFIVSGKNTVNIVKNTTGALKNVSDGADQVYDGTAKTLTPGGTIVFTDDDNNEAGTIEYRIIAPTAAATDWAEAVPTATNAETYTVEVRGVGDVNHEDATATVTYNVFIDKATTPLPEITAVGGPFTYKATIDESAFTVTAESDGTLSYTYDFKAPGASVWTNGVAFDGSAGTWKVYAHQTEGTNWYALDDVTGFEFEVAKADLVPADMTGMLVENLSYKAADQKLLKGEAYLPEYDGHGWSGTFTYYIDGVSVGTDWNDVVGKDADVDDDAYVITYTFVPASTNVNPITEPQTIGNANIAKATVEDLVFTPEPRTGLVYDATEQQLLKQGYKMNWNGSPFSAFSAKYTMKGVDYTSYSALKGTNGGAYEITLEAVPTDTKNFNSPIFTGTVTATIGKCLVDVAAQSLILDYGDYVVTPDMLIKVDPSDVPGAETLTPEEIGAQLVAFKNGWTIPDPQDAGSYPFTLEPQETDNYAIHDFVPDGGLTINKIDAVPATVAAATLTYTGADQELVTVPDPTDAEGGTMLYYLEKEETGAGPIPAGDARWSETIPVAKKHGDYKVWTMIKGDKNHNDVVAAAAIPVTIAQKALDIAFFTFDDDDMKAEFTGENLMPNFTFADGDPSALVEADFEVAKTKGTDDVTEMKNVGVYTFTFTATADGNYTGSVSKDFEITPKPIDAADVKFALDPASVEYDGADHKADVKVVPTAPLTVADFEVVTPTEMKNQGEYTITLNAKADGNYSGSTTATFTITKKALTDEMFALEYETKVFNGDDQMPDFTFADGDPSALVAADFDVAKTNAAEEDVTAMVDVDTYTFTFTATADGNYSGEITKTFTITQDEAEFVLAEAANLTYNGADQGLLKNEAETDAVDGEKVEYQVVQGEEVLVDWTEDFAAVVAKNAGVYTVKTKFTANPLNYSNPEVVEEVDVTIDKAAIGYMLGGMTKVWDGEPITEEANGEQLEKVFTLYAGGEGGKLFGNDQYDVPFTLSIPEDYRDADSYSFTQAKVEFKEGYPVNYKINFAGTGNVVIEKADIAAEDFTAPAAVAEDLTYNGEEQDLVVAGEVTAKTDAEYPNTELAGKPFGTIMYATAEDGEYSETAPKGKDADDYEVWYYVKGDKNHNDTDPVKIEKSIAPKAITFTLAFEDAEIPFDGKDKMPADVKAYDGEKALEEGTDYELAITDDAAELINAGEYTFTYTGKGNYEGSAAEATITITKVELTEDMIEEFVAEKPYTGKDQIFDLALEADGITDADYTVAKSAEEFINAGEYTFTFTAAADGNFTGEVEATFTITPLEVIAEAAAATKVYDGEEGFGELPVMTYSGVLPGDEVEFDASAAFTIEESSANVGTYTFTVDPEAIVADPANYTVSAANGNTFEITAAPLMVSWNDEADPFSKVYGADDPELTATAANLDIAGAIAGEKEAIIAQTVITRAEGEAVGKYAVTLAAKNVNPSVFANYAVEFNGYAEAFEITQAKVKVSIAALDKTYDGKAATIDVKAEDLVVTGLQNGDKKEDIFTTLPTATVGSGEEVNAGTYQVTLEGGEAADYEFEFIPATFTVKPAKVTATLTAQKVQQGKALNETAFTAEGIAEGDEDLFYVDAPGLVDMDGIVTGAAGVYAEGLTLAADESVADNYTIEATPAELEIIAADAIVLADNADFVTEAKEGVDVTFADRSINAGTWNVLALPFEATVKQISDAFGYAAVDILNEDGNTPGEVHFKVISSGTIPAYTPFIIKTTEDAGLAKDNFNQVVFHNVNIEACDGTNNSVEDAAQNKFWGTFQAVTTFYGAQYWYMSKGAWKDASKYTASKPVSLKAFRAYVEFKDVPAEGARIFVEEPDGTITAINGLEFNKAIDAEGWFTVNGMKLDEAPAQKGTYIKDGKKVIVK